MARKVVNHESGKTYRIYNRYAYLSEKRKALAMWARHVLDLKPST